MTKRIIFLLLAALFGLLLRAQTVENYGTSYTDAIPIVFTAGKATFADVRNTQGGPPCITHADTYPKKTELTDIRRGEPFTIGWTLQLREM